MVGPLTIELAHKLGRMVAGSKVFRKFLVAGLILAFNWSALSPSRSPLYPGDVRPDILGRPPSGFSLPSKKAAGGLQPGSQNFVAIT
jgi:hypothetical protein